MGRILVLGTIILLSRTLIGQNLVLNPDFEDVVQHQGDLSIYLDTFYAKNWFPPTGGSVDIYRSNILPKGSNFNLDAHKPFKTNVVSGAYCIGLFFLEFMGQMEHITGTLSQPLASGQKYSVSFYVKMHPTNTPFIPKGMGYKFSQDSIVFEPVELGDRGKASPFYDHLFAEHKVYADYEIDEYILDTTWVKYSSAYTAKGGEKYITLGRFAYRDDAKIIKQFKRLRHAPWKDKMLRFVKSDKSKVCKRFFDKKVEFDIQGSNYYYIDLVEVVPIDSTKPPPAREVVTEDNTIPEEAYNYVDLDPATAIPSERQIVIDKGFVGDLKLELGVRLKPMEKYVLEYGRRNQIVIINTAEGGGYGQMKFFLEHPARKLRKKPVRFYVEKTNSQEIEALKSAAEEIEQLAEPNFEGILLKSRSQ